MWYPKKLPRLVTYTLSSIFLISFSYATINVVPVEKTPCPQTAKVVIVYPENMEMKNSLPIQMVVKVDNYALGEDSNFERKEEIKNWNIGQSIRVIVDNKPFFAKVTKQVNPSNDAALDFEQIYEFNLPETISEGEHSLRVYLVRSYGESLKEEHTFEASTFYYKNKTPLKDANLKNPYLTYNEPSPNRMYDDSKPVLLDFYINNCKLAHDGYKVKLIIDKDFIRYLDKWTPYYIYGLRKGMHQIELLLVDSKNNAVPGLFNNSTNEIQVN
jgi:hypothetical protein